MHSIRCPTPVRCAYPTACSRHPPTHHAPVTHQWYPLLARPAPPPTPPPPTAHSLRPSTAARPALPPPTAAHAAVRTRHRRHCSAVERNPPNRPVPGTAGFSISRLTGPVCIFLAGNSAGRLGQPAPTNCNFTAPATASSKHSPRLESSTRVLDSSPRQPDHAPFFLPTPTPPFPCELRHPGFTARGPAPIERRGPIHMPSMWTPLPTFKPRGALARAIWLRPV